MAGTSLDEPGHDGDTLFIGGWRRRAYFFAGAIRAQSVVFSFTPTTAN